MNSRNYMKNKYSLRNRIKERKERRAYNNSQISESWNGLKPGFMYEKDPLEIKSNNSKNIANKINGFIK